MSAKLFIKLMIILSVFVLGRSAIWLVDVIGSNFAGTRNIVLDIAVSSAILALTIEQVIAWLLRWYADKMTDPKFIWNVLRKKTARKPTKPPAK